MHIKQKELKYYEIILYISILLTILLEAIFIFTPAVRNVGKAQAHLQKISDLKSEFLANMSHEIRTPMAGVITTVDLLSKENLTEKQQSMVDIINRSGRHLLNILNNILDISKIESADLKLENEVVNLHQLINESKILFQHSANRKKIELEVSLDDNLPKYIKGDEVRIAQILRNLIGNAMKFTPENGLVTVHAFAQNDSSNYIIFTVKDDGIGIAEDKLENIFHKFTQADSSTTRKYGGTGLGLTISRQLAKLMGGDMFVVSELNKGSTFSFVTPYHEASKEEILAVQNQEEQSSQRDNFDKNIHILLVEDYPINMQIISAQLMQLGLQNVDKAENGAEALEMIIRKKYDVILMDCQMPVLDGYEATRQIRNNEMRRNTPPSKALPIVAMTANAMVGEKEKCLESGMNYYITKPIEQKLLIEILNKLFTLKTVPNQNLLRNNVRKLRG